MPHMLESRQQAARQAACLANSSTASPPKYKHLVDDIDLQKEMSRKTETFRVLCVGDSLTEGFDQGGASFHPYAIKLRQLLLNFGFISGADQVVVEGVSGDHIDPDRGGILRRMKSRLEASAFTWVVLLAGTNDFLHSADTPAKVLANIEAAWDVALASGASVLAVTLPEYSLEDMPLAPVLEVNTMIRTRVQIRATNDGDALRLLDLHVLFPLLGLDSNARSLLWGDTIHPSAAGYDEIGEMYESLERSNE
ncbi:hypothetical protein HDU83_008016 [Entophlyctis luteolus]|nr:hypothetical protein HDU83_008016 [Entophlyctis luteolus]